MLANIERANSIGVHQLRGSQLLPLALAWREVREVCMSAWRIGPASAFFSQLGAQPKSKIPQTRARHAMAQTRANRQSCIGQ